MEKSLSENLFEWMNMLAQRTMHELNQEARTAGLSLTQMNVLMHLHYRGPTEAMRLTEVMLTSPAAASQMIERMVQQGLVERLPGQDDRRVRIVRLCPPGQQIVAASLEGRRLWAAALAESLPPTEQAAAAEVLQRLIDQAKH